MRARVCQTPSQTPWLVCLGRKRPARFTSGKERGGEKKLSESFLTRARQSCAVMDSLSPSEQMNR